MGRADGDEPTEESHGENAAVGIACWCQIMINRAALIIRFKQPFVDWVNGVDKTPCNGSIKLQEANDDTSVFLISSTMAGQIDRWLNRNYQPLFEEILEEWYTDVSLWPESRTLQLFNSWFDIELHNMVLDTLEEEIVADRF